MGVLYLMMPIQTKNHSTRSEFCIRILCTRNSFQPFGSSNTLLIQLGADVVGCKIDFNHSKQAIDFSEADEPVHLTVNDLLATRETFYKALSGPNRNVGVGQENLERILISCMSAEWEDWCYWKLCQSDGAA